MEKFVPFFAVGGQGIDVEIPEVLPDNLFYTFFDERLITALLINALRVDIASNNVKASIVGEILKSKLNVIELAPGTNRVTFQYHGMAIKVALDRRGLIVIGPQ